MGLVNRLFGRSSPLGFSLVVAGCVVVGLALGIGIRAAYRSTANAQPPAASSAPSSTTAAASRPGRVLMIGIDGCRFDALEKANTPHLDALRAEGCYADDTLIQGARYKASDTVSGPGWSSLLTGVWADKHGVDDNRFTAPNFTRYPMFFRRLREADPNAETAAFSNWPPISKRIVSDADLNLQFSEDELYARGDRDTATATVDLLRRGDPRAIFAYFGEVDANGHEFGFSLESTNYMAAIERVDALVGTLLDALKRRPNYAAENWLVLVGTDHGGFNNDHRGGRSKPQVMRGFTIVSGPAAMRGKLTEQTYIVDLPVTALTHLGVKLDPKWDLDGRAIGLKP